MIGALNKWEIDFVIEKGNRREYIQVCYLLSDEEVLEREFRGLLSIRDNYPKSVLSMDTVDLSRNGIAHYYLPAWLVGEPPGV